MRIIQPFLANTILALCGKPLSLKCFERLGRSKLQSHLPVAFAADSDGLRINGSSKLVQHVQRE